MKETEIDENIKEYIKRIIANCKKTKLYPDSIRLGTLGKALSI